MNCASCEKLTNDVEEYCHHCGEIVCFDCLDDEWCPGCLKPVGGPNIQPESAYED